MSGNFHTTMWQKNKCKDDCSWLALNDFLGDNPFPAACASQVLQVLYLYYILVHNNFQGPFYLLFKEHLAFVYHSWHSLIICGLLFLSPSPEFDQSSPFSHCVTFITAHMFAGEAGLIFFFCRQPHLALSHSLSGKLPTCVPYQPASPSWQILKVLIKYQSLTNAAASHPWINRNGGWRGKVIGLL